MKPHPTNNKVDRGVAKSLREILSQELYYYTGNNKIFFSVDDAHKAIKDLVLGCLPEPDTTTPMPFELEVDDVQYAAAYNITIANIKSALNKVLK